MQEASRSGTFAPGTLSSRESKYAVGQHRRYPGIVPECVAGRHSADEGISGKFAPGTFFPRADKYAVLHSYHAYLGSGKLTAIANPHSAYRNDQCSGNDPMYRGGRLLTGGRSQYQWLVRTPTDML